MCDMDAASRGMGAAGREFMAPLACSDSGSSIANGLDYGAREHVQYAACDGDCARDGPQSLLCALLGARQRHARPLADPLGIADRRGGPLPTSVGAVPM